MSYSVECTVKFGTEGRAEPSLPVDRFGGRALRDHPSSISARLRDLKPFRLGTFYLVTLVLFESALQRNQVVP